MDKYQRGKIYTIRCYNDNTMIYVGHTIETLSKRMTKHRSSSKNDRGKNILLYQTINGNWDNWYVELYENYPCNSKEELCKREGEVIREIGTLNKIVAGRSQKEYYEDNRDKILKYHKNYNENNKDKKAEYDKYYRINNKAEIAEYNKEWREDNRDKVSEKGKEYRTNNIDKAKEYHKVWYENNKIKILEKHAEKVVCQYCGCNSTKCNLPRHQKSAKCIKAREST